MAKSRILVVDDTPANIKILADLLRKDYLLSVATSGADALEIAASEDRPDLVLLRHHDAPRWTATKSVSASRRTRRRRTYRVIFVTAMSEVDDETKGFSLGAVDYITKPIRPPIVQARVAAHLDLPLARKTLAAQKQTAARVAGDGRRPVQRSLLPRSPRDLPPGSTWRAGMIPCDAGGGDYLDFLTDDDFAGRGFGVAVGDVMGQRASRCPAHDGGTGLPANASLTSRGDCRGSDGRESVPGRRPERRRPIHDVSTCSRSGGCSVLG